MILSETQNELIFLVKQMKRAYNKIKNATVLEGYGYEMNVPKGGGSHYTFRKSGCQPITIPKHEPIKKVYVEMVKQIVESEAMVDENAE